MERVVLVAVLGLLMLPVAAQAAPAPAEPGRTTEGTTVSHGSAYRYLLYTPSSYRPGTRVPLLVMTHGCQTTAEQHRRSTRANDVAEREGFAVLYPDVDAAGRALPGPLHQCWKFFDPFSYQRDSSDAGAIADMTLEVLRGLSIDEERVYLAGTSAGGLMAAVDSATYPDVFAASAIVASAGFLDGPCFTTGVGVPAELTAPLAADAMGARKRVVPRIAIGSDADLAFPARCTVKALDQALRTSNLVLSGTQDGPLSLTPSATRDEQVPGGRAYTVSEFRDPDGCLVGERWIIRGMPHAWPGGSPDPKDKGFTDASAPNGVEAVWAFVRRFTRSGTALPCAETPLPATAPAAATTRSCAARRLTVRLGRRARSVTATADGRRTGARLRGRRVVVTVPAGPRGRVRLTLRLGGDGGRGRTVRRTVRRC